MYTIVEPVYMVTEQGLWFVFIFCIWQIMCSFSYFLVTWNNFTVLTVSFFFFFFLFWKNNCVVLFIWLCYLPSGVERNRRTVFILFCLSLWQREPCSCLCLIWMFYKFKSVSPKVLPEYFSLKVTGKKGLKTKAKEQKKIFEMFFVVLF